MRKLGIASALLLLVGGALARAGDSREATARKALTGGGKKAWVHVAMKTFLGGPKKKCVQGEVWVFRSNGSVHIDRCVEGTVVSEEIAWQLRTLDPLDIAVIVGGTEYVLLMPELGNGKKAGTMVLRHRYSNKSTPTEDLEFTHEKE